MENHYSTTIFQWISQLKTAGFPSSPGGAPAGASGHATLRHAATARGLTWKMLVLGGQKPWKNSKNTMKIIVV